MNDELGRLLGDAFDARARIAVPDHTPVPAPRFETPDVDTSTTVVPLRRRRWLAPVAAAAAVVAAAAVGVTVAVQTGAEHGADTGSHPIAKAEKDSQPVHVKLLNSDGATYGVGMPVIAYFSRTVTDGRALQAATHVTVNGSPLPVAWFFEPSSAGHGPLEAHLRPASYWPAHARVHIAISTDGATAGKGLGFDDSLTLDFRTGADNRLTVDGQTHSLKFVSDGKQLVDCKVAMGKPSHPTPVGYKMIMDKVKAPTYGVPTSRRVAPTYALRLTYGGEYLRAATGSAAAARKGGDTTDGSTELTPKDAQTLFNDTNIGDPVQFERTGGPVMQLGAGYGDWQVSWPQWLTGGAVRTH